MNAIKMFLITNIILFLVNSCQNKCCEFHYINYRASLSDSNGRRTGCLFNGDTLDRKNLTLYLYRRIGYHVDSMWLEDDFKIEECDKLSIEIIKNSSGFYEYSCY